MRIDRRLNVTHVLLNVGFAYSGGSKEAEASAEDGRDETATACEALGVRSAPLLFPAPVSYGARHCITHSIASQRTVSLRIDSHRITSHHISSHLITSDRISPFLLSSALVNQSEVSNLLVVRE